VVRDLSNGSDAAAASLTKDRPGGLGANAMSLTEPTSMPTQTGHVTLDPDKKHDPHATRFGAFLKACIKLSASDLIMKAGQPPKVRVRGALKPLDTEPVSQDEFVQIAKHILDEDGCTCPRSCPRSPCNPRGSCSSRA